VAVAPAEQQKKGNTAKSEKPAEQKVKRIRVGSKCPLCGKGKVIKGKTAYGCSRWNDPQQPCQFRKPF
jgi:DNA topoisomerase-3